VIVSGAIAACGSNDRAAVAPGQLNRNLVDQADIASVKAGTPERTVLEWFQAVQFDDIGGVRQLTAPNALKKLSPDKLAADIAAVAPAMAKPSVVSRRLGPSLAAVRVLLLSYTRGHAKPVLAIPATLVLVRVHGRWLMSDLSLLIEGARAINQSKP